MKTETDTTKMKILSIADYMGMTNIDLLAWWIFDQGSVSPTHTTEHIAMAIASFDAMGREAVSSILGDAGYEVEDESEVKIIRLQDAKGLLTRMNSQKDFRLFTVWFVKKTGEQELRQMTCRYGVKVHLKGGEKAYDDKDYDLSTVFDIDAAPRYSKDEQEKISAGKMQTRGKGDYRAINLEGLIKMKIGGRVYVVAENKDMVDIIKGEGV